MPALRRMTKSPTAGRTRGEGVDRRVILGCGTHNLMRTGCLNVGWSLGENPDGPRLELIMTD